MTLKGHNLRVSNSVKTVLFPSEKGSPLKGNSLLLGANSFLLEETPFQKGLCFIESKQKISKGRMINK